MKKALLLTCLVVSAFGQSFNVDTFDVGDFAQTPVAQFDQTGLDPAHVVGGARYVNFYNDTSGSATIAGGSLSYDRPGNTVLLFRYGSYGDANAARDLHLNLSGGLMVRFTVTEMSEPCDINFELYDFEQVGTDTSHRYGGARVHFNSPGTRELVLDQIPWNISNDLTDIAGIQIQFVDSPGINGQFVFSGIEITPVPEPSAYAALFGLGLLGFAGLRQFRRSPKTS